MFYDYSKSLIWYSKSLNCMENDSKKNLVPKINITAINTSSDMITISSFERNHPPDMTSYYDIKKKILKEKKSSSKCCLLI